MTSFAANVIEQSGFQSTFTVQGQIYHRIDSVHPVTGKAPQFLQIYFTGNHEKEADSRCAIVSNLKKKPIVCAIQCMLHDYNELIKSFKVALERMPTQHHKLRIRADKTPIGEHERRYNAPQAEEVAAIMPFRMAIHWPIKICFGDASIIR